MNIAKMHLAAACAATLSLGAFPASANFTPEGHSPDTVAFFPFTGYANGTRWDCPDPAAYTSTSHARELTGMSNALNGERHVWAYTAANGYVTVTNETPGKYLFSSATAKAPLVSEFMSLRPVTSGSRATWIQLPNAFCKDIADAGSGGGFTLELFVKNDNGSKGNALWFDIGPGTGAGNYRVQVQFPQSQNYPAIARAFSIFTDPLSGKGNTADNNYSSVTAASDLRDSKWHHVALVYEQPDSSTNGFMRLYLDYKASARVFYVQRATGDTFGVFRLGEVSGGWNGLYSALRVSSRALAPAEFLHVSDEVDGWREDRTIAFYPLDEMAPGYVFTAENNSGANGTERTLWETNYFNRAATVGYSSSGEKVSVGVKHAAGGMSTPEFYSTNDVPARYIYDGLRATAPLREPAASLATFGPANTGNSTDWINFSMLAKDLWDCESYTLEFFAKVLGHDDAWAVLGYWDLGADNQNRCILARNKDEYRRVQLQHTGNLSTVAAYPGGDSFEDGRWHHIAIVCNASSKAKLYCDYTLVSDEMSVTKAADKAKVIDSCRLSGGNGSGNQWAEFSCFRATAAALAPEEFLYASDNPGGVLADIGEWGWTLEGTIDETVAAAICGKAAIDADQYAFKDGHAFSGTPTGAGTAVFASPVLKGRRSRLGVRGDRNRSSAAVSGRHFTAATSGVLCDPGNVFTIEALANVAAPAEGCATLLGTETASGDTAWRLAVDSTGTLVASFRNQAGAIQSFTVMEGFAGTAHHVAIAADLPARTATVNVDYAASLTLSASDFALPLAGDGTRFTLGGGCGGAEIAGMVDEIRCVHAILSAGALTRYSEDATVISLR